MFLQHDRDYLDDYHVRILSFLICFLKFVHAIFLFRVCFILVVVVVVVALSKSTK